MKKMCIYIIYTVCVFKCVTSSSSPRIWLITHTCLLVILISQPMRQGTCHRPPWAGCHKSLGCDMRPSEVWWQSPKSHHVGSGVWTETSLWHKKKLGLVRKTRVSFCNDVVYDDTTVIISMRVSNASTSSWKFPRASPYAENACDFCAEYWILIQDCHKEIPKFCGSIISIAFNEICSNEVSERKVRSNPSLVVGKLVYHFPLELEALSAWGQGCKAVWLFIMFHPRLRDRKNPWPMRWKNCGKNSCGAFQQAAFFPSSSTGNCRALQEIWCFWDPQAHEEGRL